MSDNYLMGKGPAVNCDYCGSTFHSEATGCPNPRCGAHAGAKEFDKWNDSRKVTGADYVRGMCSPFGARNL